MGDLQDYGGDLRALVGSFGPKLRQFALGEDDRPLELGDEVKSISGEETFLHDTEDRGVLRACLREQAAEIAAKLKRRHLARRPSGHRHPSSCWPAPVSSRRLSPAPRSFGILAREAEGTAKTESGIAADQLEFCGGRGFQHTRSRSRCGTAISPP